MATSANADPDFEPISSSPSPPRPFEVDQTRWELLQSMFLSGVGKDNQKVIAKLIKQKDRRISTVARERIQRLWTSINEFKQIFNGQDQSVMQECHYKEALCEILTQQADQTACWKLILAENINPFDGKLIISCWAAYGVQSRECKFFTERADKVSADLREQFKRENGYLSEHESSGDSDTDEGKNEGEQKGDKGKSDHREGKTEGENDGFSESDDDFVAQLRGTKCNVQAPLSSSPKPNDVENQNLVEKDGNLPKNQRDSEIQPTENHFENLPEQNLSTEKSGDTPPNPDWSEGSWVPTLTEIPPVDESSDSDNQPSPIDPPGANVADPNPGHIPEPWQPSVQVVQSSLLSKVERLLREYDHTRETDTPPVSGSKLPTPKTKKSNGPKISQPSPLNRSNPRRPDHHVNGTWVKTPRKNTVNSVKTFHREGKSGSKSRTQETKYEQRQQRDRTGCNRNFQQNLVRTREAEVKAAKTWGRVNARGRQEAKGAPKRQQRFTPPVPKRGRSNEVNKMREMSNQFEQCLTRLMTSHLDGFRAQVQDLNHSFQPQTRHIREYDLPDDLPLPICTKPKNFRSNYHRK